MSRSLTYLEVMTESRDFWVKSADKENAEVRRLGVELSVEKTLSELRRHDAQEARTALRWFAEFKPDDWLLPGFVSDAIEHLSVKEAPDHE